MTVTKDWVSSGYMLSLITKEIKLLENTWCQVILVLKSMLRSLPVQYAIQILRRVNPGLLPSLKLGYGSDISGSRSERHE